MTEAAPAAEVEFLIEKLKQVVIRHADLISGADHEVEKLDNHLSRFKAFFGDSPTDGKQLIRRIRVAVHDAENTIDSFVNQKNSANDPNPDQPHIVRRAVEEIEAVLEEICCENTRTDSNDADVEDGGTNEDEDEYEEDDMDEGVSVVKEQNVVVGIEDEAERLSRHLTEESAELQVLSIIGMAGLGKTILAQKVFHDASIIHEFPIRIWVYLSRAFTPQEIFLHILKEFVILSDDIMRRTDKELADLVATFLRDDRFLLVMDDLWRTEDWDKLKVALPMTNKMGRVLITSRAMDVGRHVNTSRDPHMMRFLTQDESFKLLCLEAFFGLDLTPELRALGEHIAGECRGHPLAIMLIGGLIFKSHVTDESATMDTGRKVSESLSSVIHDDLIERISIIIAMSYENLPCHLRECLLYFGMFPEDFEIPIWKLIRLWIAEGFIEQNLDVSLQESLEETAEGYLLELIRRNLVKCEKFKSCRIHDLILDFCIAQAATDGFFQQIKISDDGGFQPPVNEELKFRRLCIHSNALNFLCRKPNGPIVGSFICSTREEMVMPMKDLSAIPKGFKLLKVLDVEPINFNLKLPRDLFRLLHLKYLFLSVKVDVLPSAFSLLLNIQTLVFETSNRTLEVRADILNLAQLRHFKTKASAALLETSTSSPTAGENFQTLKNISPESCTKDFFGRARNLKKLGVRGNLASLLDGEKGSFDSLGKLEDLEKLKLLYDLYPIPPSGLPILSLPSPYKFPPRLKILTLSRTCLDWGQMPIIGSLKYLEVLKLEDKAFVGETWEVNDGGFCFLVALRIKRMNLKIWLASDNQFPTLQRLQLQNCDDLQQIPVELADVPSFLKLDLFHCKRAAAAARKIEAKIKQLDNVGREFHLSISPFQQ